MKYGTKEMYICKISELYKNKKLAKMNKIFFALSSAFIPFSIIFWNNHSYQSLYVLYFILASLWACKNIYFFYLSALINPASFISASFSIFGVLLLRTYDDIGLACIAIACGIGLISKE